MAPVVLLLLVLLSQLSPAPARVEHRSSNQLSSRGLDATEARGWVRACYLFRDVPLDQIDPWLCTHLLAFFGHVTADGLPQVNDADLDKLAQLVRMRQQQNPLLRVCLTFAANNDAFATAAASNTSRASFAAAAAQLLQQTDLDGLDFDWEFPAFFRPGHERRDFSLLLEATGAALRALPRPRLLTAAVGGSSTIVDVSYEVPRIAAALDFVSVMTYDFHFYKTLEPATGHNAPLFASSRDRGFLATLNTNFSAHLWLDRGVPRSKLLLGLPTYGHGWHLRDSAVHGLLAPASGPWKSGYVTLADVCRLLQGNGTAEWDPFALAPYAYSGAEWVSFEDARSMAAKASLVRALDLAGAMTYNLDNDDWGNVCGRGAFPLHRLVRDMLPSLEQN
ncbi:acidic mammalian chitinase-like [Pollicipes pollicipes]|uniref:acidic mammalian chitinase-like n=1 Tax=Pollicipes pollicipes TaxID=41117 RepID=UPI001884D1C4|nr:acidic mammalian chitinase-like [Pollicipes pollicipes]